jgi:hypothetical protein
VSRTDRTRHNQVGEIDQEDRVWLDEPIELYADLLVYLREH